MTIQVTSIDNLSPTAVDAMRMGAEVECADCRGHGWVIYYPLYVGEREKRACQRCAGRGHVRYHDLTTGPLASPFKVGGSGRFGVTSQDEAIRGYEKILTVTIFVARGSPENKSAQEKLAAFDAIRDGDMLVGPKDICEIVARMVAERDAN